MNRNSFKKRGFSLVEILVYIAIMTIVMVVVVNIIITIAKSNKQSFVYNNIKNSAISSLEKIIRETRASESFVIAMSGEELTLNSRDENSLPKTVKFYLSNGLLKVDINGSYFGPLNINGTKVLSLNFKSIDAINSKAVKIEITIEGENKGFVNSEDFYSTVVLRNSY